MNVTTKAQLLKKLPSWAYKLAAQTWIDKEYPRHIFIETTSACNLRCDYCPREKRGNHMDFSLFKAIVEEASTYGPRSFSLHLFGEPLLYPHILECISFIKEQNPHHTTLLTTNGTYLEKFIGETRLYLVDQILWSWRKEAKLSEATKEKLRKWGKFRVRFIKEVTPPEAYKEWENWPNVEHRSLHSYGGNIDVAQFSDTASGAPNAANGSPRWPCYHLWLAPAVAWNGEILLCCADPHRKEAIGRFPQMSVHEAWSGAKIKAIRESHLQGKFTGICENCDVWKNYKDIFFKWQQR